MTAHAMLEDQQRCLDAGMDGFLSKPIRPTELFERIEQTPRPAWLSVARTALPSRIDRLPTGA